MTAQLPPGWTVDEDDEGKLPPGWKVEPTPSRPEEFRDIVGEELAAKGIEDENEFERAAELGNAEATRGFLSGASFGLTKHVPGLKPGENAAAKTGEVIGSLIPLSGLMWVFQGPVMKVAAKSPVLQHQLGSLGTMFGVGATSKGLETLAKWEIPSVDDLLEHGVEWALLDGALQTLGVAGRFAKGLFTRARATGQSRLDLVNRVTGELAESGIDMSNAEAVSAKALEILERPLSEAELKASQRKLELPKEEISPVSKFAQQKISNPIVLEFETKLSTTKEPSKNELAEKILNQETISAKDLKTKKIQEDQINKLASETISLSDPYQPEGINFTKEAESLEKNAIQEQIDSIGTRAASEEELGTSIREDIETQLEARKEQYRPLYKQAEEAAGQTNHVPQNTARVAGEKLKRIGRLSTKPEGYNAVLRTLENVLKDAGFVIQRDEKGAIDLIVSAQDVAVEDTIELARRLNEIVDYEAVEPTVKDALKSVARAAKQDIREGLASNPDALAAFELAEQAHAETASRFSRESIRKTRGQQAGEKISKMAESPTAFAEMKEVLSPEQFLQLEREMLEKLNNQTYEKAKKTLKELERHMSAENRKLARDIVEAKNPHNPQARKKLLQDAILNDMSNAFTNGTRPEKTLQLWKSPKGQKIVKETFHNSPNWAEVKSYLEKQSFNDMVSSVLKDGKIDMKKFNSFMRDQGTINNIRSAGGEEAVTFFKSLDSQVKQLEANINLLEKLPKQSDINRGKDILNRQKRKNLEAQKLEAESHRKVREKIEVKTNGERGKELIRKTKEKNLEIPKEVKVAEEALETQRAIKKESSGERGSKILQRMIEKDFPLQAKFKKWRQIFTETMGLNEKGVMSVFGLMKLGLPNTVVSLISYRLFNRLLTNPRLRRAFTEAAKPQTNSLKFILALEKMGDEMDEEGI